MIEVLDKTADAKRYTRTAPRRYMRSWGDVTTQVVHRFSLRYLKPGPIRDSELTADHIAAFFHNPRYKTAGLVPYHFLIRPHGEIDQMLPLEQTGLAAGSLNARGVQIAVVGDFRKEPPRAAQAHSLINLNKLLWKLGAIHIVGHTQGHQKAGVTADPKKECPGRHFLVENLSQIVQQQLIDDITREAQNAGVIVHA